MNNFEILPIKREITHGLNDLGFTEMFPIQAAAISPLLEGRDVMGQAKTGTGKTAAFGIPMIQLVDIRDDSVQGIVLVPTRELAQQVASDLKTFAKYLPVKVLAVYGGAPIYSQMEALQNTIHIVVGTPGRIIDHIRRGTLILNGVKFVVLDEADRMLDMGFRDDMDFILNRTPEKRQTAMFSATLPDEILGLASRHMYAPEKIFVSKDEIAVEEIDQLYHLVDPERKFQALCSIMGQQSVSRALIFCSTKMGADRLVGRLSRTRRDVAVIHGDLTQPQRERALADFRRGRIRFLVATDVASRGLDIDAVSHVVNYDVPSDPLLYFHRIGRTGRAGASGTAVTLVSRREMADLRRIQGMSKIRMKEWGNISHAFEIHPPTNLH
ncbi:MAG TPA: DEAD/DEAH box helicase, partial [Candidatus Bathyarchaeia archaeon]|nr:DEAD/DEAH box helicase [Candidatus Bathyarchaeia archaeon]